MRPPRRLLRGITAAVLGLTLGMSATVQPARANPDGANYLQYLTLIHRVFEMGQDGLTPAEANQLLQELIGVLEGTKTDLLTRLNTQLANEIRGSTEAAVNKVEMLKVPWMAGPALLSIHDAAYRAKAHIVTVKDSDEALDVVGRAVIVLFNLLNTAYIKVDSDEGTNLAPGQRPYFRQALETLIQEMAPECWPGGHTNAGMKSYTCKFANKTVRAEWWAGTNSWRIDNGDPIPGEINQSIVVEIVMKDTIWQVARDTHAKLVHERVPLPPNP